MLNNNMPSSSADGDGVRAAQAGAESRPKMVLTIDDDPYIRKYITELLSDNGYETCWLDGAPAWSRRWKCSKPGVPIW